MHRQPLLHRASALLLLAALAAVGLAEAIRWIGQPFPGFLLLGNRVVASAGLEGWPAVRGGEIFQLEVIALDGEPVHDAADALARVRAVPVGTPLTWRFRSGSAEVEKIVPTRRFELEDFAELFGLYLLNGLVLGGFGIWLWGRLDRYPGAAAALPLLGIGAVWGLSALDLYGPCRLFRLHALAETLLAPAALQLAFCFPRRPGWLARRPELIGAVWAAALAIGLVYQLGLTDPTAYVVCHLAVTSLFGAALLTLLAAQLLRWHLETTPSMRLALRRLGTGLAVTLAVPILVTVGEIASGGSSPQNAVGVSAFLLPVVIGQACAATKQQPGDG